MSSILVVDDEQAVRELTVEILRQGGHRPHGVESVRAALELLEQKPFDLVVSDVAMPELTGFELLREVREHRPELPVVLMTGGSDDHERISRAVELGASALIFKPFSHAELNEAVAAALTP